VASAKNDKSTGSSVYVYYQTTTLHKYGRSMIYARRDDRVSEGPEFLAELCAVEIQASAAMGPAISSVLSATLIIRDYGRVARQPGTIAHQKQQEGTGNRVLPPRDGQPRPDTANTPWSTFLVKSWAKGISYSKT